MLSARIFFLLSLCGFALAEQNTPAVRILSSIPYKSLPSIINKNEWQELQLDRLITQLDRTKTSFGPWGLEYLLHPIADKNELIQRQKIVAFLVENPETLQTLQQKLSEIKKHEKSLISYWDKNDQINKNCDQFYYSLPFVKDYFNKSTIALNVGVTSQLFTAFQGLLVSLCLKGVSDELLNWSMIKERDFDLMRGIKNGIEEPLRQHSCNLFVLKGRENDTYTAKDVINVEYNGSWGDRNQIYQNGYTVDLSSLGLSSNYVVPKATNIITKTTGILGASTRTIIYDYFWATNLLSIGRNIIFMRNSLKELTQRIQETGSCFNAIMHIFNETHKYSHEFGTQLCYNKDHQQGIEFMNHCAKKQRNHQTLYNYSFGHILTMHKEVKQKKSSFISILQTIALLDAYCSIAQLIKDSENKHNKFSFVTFVDSHEPYIAYEDAWLPLLSQEKAVFNNLFLGNQYAGKMIITGPNGGGKSTILKTYGIAAVLAQSWTIIPASCGQQTIFDGIKTGIAPHEDLQNNLSTFMAEKKCMEQLDTFIKTTHQDNTALVLIDEPYKGTVDDESAKRIYSFGMNAASHPHALLCIATHVKKPILLATDTKGVFANYHVKIKETSLGNFERLFSLQEGPATWWFEDEGQRSRFVDWISILLEQQAKK